MEKIKYTFTFEKCHKLEKYFTPRKEITFFKYGDTRLDLSEYLEIFQEFLGRELNTESNEDIELYRNILETIKRGECFQYETYMSYKRLTLFIESTGE